MRFKEVRNMKNKIKFVTNTAWLLNMWFHVNSKMWPEIRKWIKMAHEENWKRKNSFIEVTFRIIKEKVSQSKETRN